MRRWLVSRDVGAALGDWRRSAFLVLFGLMHVLYGWSYIVLGPTSSQVDALIVPLQLAQAIGIGTGWAFFIAGWLWVVNGIVAAVSGMLPAGHDWWGFVVLSTIQTAWAVAFLLSAVIGDNPRGISQATFFLAFMGACMLMSGMVSADRVAHEGKALALLPVDVVEEATADDDEGT